MGKINVLDFEVANLIAAGEVVDRPASCVKELMENAIDAGSTSITAEIQRGGVSFIRISDNGCGMEKEDLPVAILRHATSKIHTAEDLSGIVTLGFRGEALAAISSVSKLRILSKIPGAAFGAVLEVEGGSITNLAETGCADGTTIIVEDLFYNVPARKKFLKKDSTEGAACSTVIEKIALSHPEISIRFISDGEVRFVTSGNGKLRETIYAIYGREIARRSLSVDREENGIRVTGIVSEPDMARANRNMENFFINGRYVKSRTAAAAVEQAYSSKGQADKFPFCVLNITLNPAVVDVNVHPTKLEVKFTNEKIVFDAVYYAVQTALQQDAIRPELQMTNPSNPLRGIRPTDQKTPKGSAQKGSAPMGSGIQSYQNAFVPMDKPLATGEQLRITAKAYREGMTKSQIKEQIDEPESTPISSEKSTVIQPDAPTVEKEQNPTEEHTSTEMHDSAENTSAEECASAEDAALLEQFRRADANLKALSTYTPSYQVASEDLANEDLLRATEEKKEPEERDDPPDYLILGEAYNCYVIVQLEDRILMIDKHAAHERIIFDELCEKMRTAKHSGQILLLPCKIRLLCSESEAVEEYADRIRAMGFDFVKKSEEVSQVLYSLTQIPEELTIEEASTLFTDLAGRLSSVTATVESASAEFFESRLWQAACKAAIKGGIKYDMAHIQWICDKLLVKSEDGKSVIRTCPHGRPVAFEIKKSSIDRQFGRTN